MVIFLLIALIALCIYGFYEQEHNIVELAKMIEELEKRIDEGEE